MGGVKNDYNFVAKPLVHSTPPFLKFSLPPLLCPHKTKDRADEL